MLEKGTINFIGNSNLKGGMLYGGRSQRFERLLFLLINYGSGWKGKPAQEYSHKHDEWERRVPS